MRGSSHVKLPWVLLNSIISSAGMREELLGHSPVSARPLASLILSTTACDRGSVPSCQRLAWAVSW